MQEQDVITVEGLRKHYGPVKAVDGVTFQVNGRSLPASQAGSNRQTEAAFNPGLIGVIDGVRRVEQQGDEVVVYGQGEGLISAVILALEAARVPFHNLRTEQANLEDVFLALTGRAIRD